MDLTLCRTCVTSLEDKDCCEITSFLEGKSIIQLISEVAQVKVEYEDALPKHICVPCAEKLYNLYEFREQIRQTDSYLRDSSLTVIKLENDDPRESMICFAGEDFDIEKVNLIVDKEENNDTQAKIDDSLTNFSHLVTEETAKQTIKKEEVLNVFDDEFKDIRHDELLKEKSVENKFRKCKIYKCKECNITCKTAYLYRLHRVKHREKFSCQFCDKKLRTKSVFENHIRIHTGEKPFKCEECGKSFRNKMNLSEHQKKMHALNKPHVCETCGKAFALSYDLKKHFKRHGPEKTVMCEICSKLFFDSQDLYHHKKCHNPTIVACNNCGKKVQQRNLSVHMLSHKLQRFECDICLKTFTLKQTLNQHKRSMHEGKKAYKCKECGKCYAHSTNLSRHLKTHSGVRFQCMECNKIFAYKTHASKHKKKCHPAQAHEDIVIAVGTPKNN